jgi:MFS family permease
MRVLGWAFAVGGILVAVAAALNVLGLARGRLLKNPLGQIENLGFFMMGAGVAGFLWPPGAEGDAPVDPWRFYFFGVMGAGFVLLIGPEVWRSYRRRARAEADALFFLRLYTDAHDWRPKHFVLLGAFAVSVFLCSQVPDNYWQLVALIPLIALLESLRTLPVHHGRRPPNTLGSAPQP